MKTASVQQVPKQWSEILRWVVAGEEVEVTEHNQVVAKLVPAKSAATPDFLGRAKAVWGEAPPGKPLSALVSNGRIPNALTARALRASKAGKNVKRFRSKKELFADLGL